MRYFVIFISIVYQVLFGYDFNCSKSYQEMFGDGNFTSSLQYHTCCPISQVNREVDCRMCGGFWYGSTCHLKRKNSLNALPIAINLYSDNDRGIAPMTLHLTCNVKDEDGEVVKYIWSINNRVENSSSEDKTLVLTDPGSYHIKCRGEDDRGGLSNWLQTNIEVAFPLYLHNGWNLIALANSNNINLSDLNIDYKIIWSYKDGKWFFHTTDNKIKSQLINKGYKLLYKLYPARGYWILKDSDEYIPFYGETYDIELNSLAGKKWYLLGSGKAWTPSSSNRSIKIMWKWENGNWLAFSSDKNISNIIDQKGIQKIKKVKRGEGFWIKIN